MKKLFITEFKEQDKVVELSQKQLRKILGGTNPPAGSEDWGPPLPP